MSGALLRGPLIHSSKRCQAGALEGPMLRVFGPKGDRSPASLGCVGFSSACQRSPVRRRSERPRTELPPPPPKIYFRSKSWNLSCVFCGNPELQRQMERTSIPEPWTNKNGENRLGGGFHCSSCPTTNGDIELAINPTFKAQKAGRSVASFASHTCQANQGAEAVGRHRGVAMSSASAPDARQLTGLVDSEDKQQRLPAKLAGQLEPWQVHLWISSDSGP